MGWERLRREGGECKSAFWDIFESKDEINGGDEGKVLFGFK